MPDPDDEITDILGTTCLVKDTVQIIGGPSEEKVLVCKANREKGLKAFKILDAALSILDDLDSLENVLAVLDVKESEKLYAHPVLKEYDLLP